MSIQSLIAEILFVGHSLIGPDLPGLVEAGLRRMEQPAQVQAQVINGAPLRYNWDNSASAEGVDGRALLAGRGVDALILTEGIPLAAQVTWNDTPGFIAKWGALARATRPDAQVFLYETWHSLDSGPDLPNAGDPNAGLTWRARLDADLPQWQAAADAASAVMPGDPVRLIPAGQAMARLSDAIDAGQVPGLASARDLFHDDIHPNAKGLYFLAMVHLAAITGQSPEGLPAMLGRSWPSRDAVIRDDLAPVLQRIAWQAVSGYVPPPAPVLAPVLTLAPPPAQLSAAAEPPAAQATTAATEPLPEPAPIPAPPVNVDLPDGLTGVTNPNLALGLTGITDWTVQQPFLDVFKTARPWVGHLPGQWGGWDHDRLASGGWLDAEGWPKALPPDLTGISTLVLTDLPPETGGVAGRYVLTWQGKGALRIEGSVANLKQQPGQASFDFAPNTGTVLITLDAIDPVDPIRRLQMVREDRAALLAAGQIFNPDWLDRIRGTRLLRFMDWMATNNSTLSRAEDRPLPGDYTWARIGVPAEVMVDLANELDADGWFTLPHLADDALVETYARIAHDRLEPGRRAWVEFSNEVWNWQFGQAHWADDLAEARWGEDEAWVQGYALRAAQVADIWAGVFGDAGRDRLVRVVGTQTGWLGLETQILEAPLVIGEGLPAPWQSFDAYAVTGYFSGGLGGETKAALVRDWLAQSEAAAREAASSLSGDAATAYVAAHRYDLATTLAVAELRNGATTGDPSDSVQALLTTVFPHHAAIARDKGLDLVMYEGGTHLVGLGPVVDDPDLTAFFVHLNYSPEMGALYTELLQGWASISPAPFNAFTDVSSPGKWGSWGALRHLGDDNPRWQALAQDCGTC